MEDRLTIEEEYYNDWLNDNYHWLEIEFYSNIPPEDQPLDDDIPDYLDAHSDEFEEYCREEFKDWKFDKDII